MRKFAAHAYEVELPRGIGISPIFNVAYLYPYKETKTELQEKTTEEEVQTVNWEEQMPKTVKKEVEAVLEKRVQENHRTSLFSISSPMERTGSGGC